MAKQSITIELDEETIGYLVVLGAPIEVLAQLAYSAHGGTLDAHSADGTTTFEMRLISDESALRLQSPQEVQTVAWSLYRRPLPADATEFSSPAGRQLFAEALAAGGMEPPRRARLSPAGLPQACSRRGSSAGMFKHVQNARNRVDLKLQRTFCRTG